MKREARSVNEDPRGNASGTRSGEGEEGCIYARSVYVRRRGRKKGISGVEKGAEQRTAGRELFLGSTHDPPTAFAHLALLLSSVSRRALGKLIPIKASRYATATVQGGQGGIHRLGGDEKGRRDR